MKLSLHISGLMSAFFLAGWFITFLIDNPRHYIFLIAGLVMFLLVYLPVKIHMKRKHKQRMEELIKEYKEREQMDSNTDSKTPGTKGWNMNNSPFRSRKSGLQWGGGNIHASTSSRGTRKKFLGN